MSSFFSFIAKIQFYLKITVICGGIYEQFSLNFVYVLTVVFSVKNTVKITIDFYLKYPLLCWHINFLKCS